MFIKYNNINNEVLIFKNINIPQSDRNGNGEEKLSLVESLNNT